MDILITGGAGFIGSNICKKLIELKHNIACLDNFNDFYDPKIKEKNILPFKNNINFKLYRDDILNKQALESIFKKHNFDIVIHLAARAGVRPSITNALLYEEVNVSGTINILDCCRRHGVNKLIFASSSSVYGGNKKVPFSETDNVDFPVSPYAATKKSGELICYAYNHLFGISIFAMRFFTVYGPCQRPEMAIHQFTKNIINEEPVKIFGDGSSSRDYTFIDDITETISANLEKVSGFEIFNLGNSNPVKLMDIVSMIEAETHKKAKICYLPFQPGDVLTTFADITKAKKMLKYNPKTNINKGISKFVKWYGNEYCNH